MKNTMFLLFLCSVFFVGCGKASEETTTNTNTNTTVSTSVNGNVQIDVLSRVNIVKDGLPGFSIHIQNTGTKIAQNIQCTVNVRINNTVSEDLEGTFLFLDDSPNLGVNEVRQVEAFFTTIYEHQAYDAIVFDFGWKEDYSDTVKHLSVSIP